MKKIWNIAGLLIFYLATSALLADVDEIFRELTETFGAKIVFYAALIAATGMLWDVTKGVLIDELSIDVGWLLAMVGFGLVSIGLMKAGHRIGFGFFAFVCGCAGVSVLRGIGTARSNAEKVRAQFAQEKLIEEIDAVINAAMQDEGVQAPRKLPPTAKTSASKVGASPSRSIALERMF
ncbi:membrane hypothetical protein [Paraburkholderia tropica]|uniref:hypothetical protein n=1 Tax=Paraburkholderia tropica TaxID=92647 RepID=UPI001CB47A68|nr:hypothetical protein [Paraburkholderia tropica]CAG9214247.1 membrane hypothetical protein [Paraburkholderia tropica]